MSSRSAAVVMHAKSGSPPHTGQMPRFHAPNGTPAAACSTSAVRIEKWAHRPGEDLVEHFDGRVAVAVLNQRCARSGRVGRSPDLVETCRVCRLECIVASEDVGDLSKQQPSFVPIDRKAIEIEQRSAARQTCRQLLV